MPNTNTITPINGSATFPVDYGEYLKSVETIASQNITAVKNTNKIENAFKEYAVDENGKVIVESVIRMAEGADFTRTEEGAQPDLSPSDPSIEVRYFNNWKIEQFKKTIRKDEIREALIKGKSAEEVASEVIATLTEGEGASDYAKMRAILDNTEDVGLDASVDLFNGKKPLNMKGVLYAIRAMFNAIKNTNDYGVSEVDVVQGVDVANIRIAINEDILALIDMVELASLFNLSKEEIVGTIVKVPFSGDAEKDNLIRVYDVRALGRGTRVYEYGMDVLGLARYTNHGLTTDRCYFYNPIFKCYWLDVTKAVETAKDTLMGADETADEENA